MDATNPKHIEIMKKAARQFDSMRRDFIRHAMSTRQGRAYYWDFFERAHVFQTSMPTDGNANKLIFAEGERNQGLIVLADIMAFCPNEFVTMMREANERRITNDDRLRRSDEDTRGSDNVTIPDTYITAGEFDDPTEPAGEYEPGLEDEPVE